MEKERGDPDLDGYAMLKMAVEDGLRRGIWRRELKSADLIAQLFWAAVHGVASLQIAQGPNPWIEWASLEDRTRHMVDAILRGLLREPASTQRPATKTRVKSA